MEDLVGDMRLDEMEIDSDKIQWDLDLSLMNELVFGGKHSSKCPCPFCEFELGSRERRVWDLRTFEGILDWNVKWMEETGGDEKLLKYYKSCKYHPASFLPSKGRVIDKFPPPELHIRLGANKFVKSLDVACHEASSEWILVRCGGREV